MGKYCNELLQTLMNWNENLRIDSYKDLLFLLRRLPVRTLVWMGTSDMLDDEFGFDLLDSLLYFTMFHYILLLFTIFYYVLLNFTIFCYILLCFTMFCYVLLCFAIFYYILLYFTILWVFSNHNKQKQIHDVKRTGLTVTIII